MIPKLEVFIPTIVDECRNCLLVSRAQDAPCFDDGDCPAGSNCDVRKVNGELWGCCCFFATPVTAPTKSPAMTISAIMVSTESLVNVVRILPVICSSPEANCNPCPMIVRNC
ncbi:unnamed protein product [Gordionus sp. m RMFG-2023]